MCQKSIRLDADLILEDSYITSSGKKYTTDWKGLKERSLLLADSFTRLGMDEQAAIVRECGTLLEFREPVSGSADGRMKLHKANFCRNRLCSMCMKRRQMKIFSQVSRVMDVACSMGKYEFVFLTLTHPNCYGDELPTVLDSMFSAFADFSQRPVFKRAFPGWYRALEVNFDPQEKITCDMYWGNPKRHLKQRKAYYDRLCLTIGDDNPNFMKFHPHFHVILAVERDYFTGPNYLSQEQLASMWSKNLGVPGEYRQVFIEKVKPAAADRLDGRLKKAVSEVAKYPIKDFEIFVPEHDDLTDYAVDHLYHSLFNRRMIAYGGLLKKIHRDLKLSDPIDGDLVHVDDEQVREDIEYIVKRFCWRVGANSGYNYYLDASYKTD